MAQKAASSSSYTPVPLPGNGSPLSDGTVVSDGPKTGENPFLGWIGEILSIVAGLGCLIAVAAILGKMQDQPLSNWSFFMSINATVALLITASKVTAMFSIGSFISQSKWFYFRRSPRRLRDFDLFEGASRGPSGALWLLLSTQMRVRPLALIGSIATVLALGADTFGQLLVDTSGSRDVEISDGHASFGISLVYDSGVSPENPELGGGLGSGLYPNMSTVDTAMQGAIYKALFDVQTQPVFNCTSNCVWRDVYTSLGFGTNCTDVTTATQATIESKDTSTGTWYNMTTPSNISLQAGWSNTVWLTLAQVAAVDYLEKYRLGTPTRSISISSEFARFAILTAAYDQDGNTGLPDDTYPGAWSIYECSINLMAYNYTNITASGNDFNIGSTVSIPLTSGELLSTMLTFSQPNLPNMTVQGIDLEALGQFFTSSRFSGTTYSGDEPPNSTTGVGGVLRKGDVPTLFQSMAESMTDQLRSGYNSTASGLSVKSVTYVQVRWQWLSLPIFIQVAAVLLLVLAIWGSFTDRSPLWKSSTVAMLFHEMNLDAESKVVVRTDVESVDRLNKLAKETWAMVESRPRERSQQPQESSEELYY